MRSLTLMLAALFVSLYANTQSNYWRGAGSAGIGALSGTLTGMGQVKSVNVEKVQCYDIWEQQSGYRLVIALHKDDTIIRTPVSYYELEIVRKLTDSMKLILIDKLLQFKGDTSGCCRKVGRFYYDGIERTCAGKPKSQNYSIQIDALYMINKIVYPEATSLYSCWPVIVNAQTGAELNNQPDEIKQYYKVYEKSFEAARLKGILDTSFRINTRYYAWFRGTIIHE